MRFISNNIRLATVKSIDYVSGMMTTEWCDQPGPSTGPSVPILQPYAGQKGEGIFVGGQVGMIIAFAMKDETSYTAISIIPTQRVSSFNLSSMAEASYDDSGNPFLKAGEVVISGLESSNLRFDQQGNILLKNHDEEGIFMGNCNDVSHRCSIKKSLPTEYVISKSGIKVDGIIRRDVRFNYFNVCENYLYSPEFEYALEEVGWDPYKDVVYTNKIKRKTNPALVESRSVIYEFSRDWNVGSLEIERKKSAEQKPTDKNQSFVPSNADRNQNRSDVLDLSLANPNELIEYITGTVVDVFGNILDINKNIIPPPKNDNMFLDRVFENIRHSVALSIEMNSRKGHASRTQNKVVLMDGLPDVDAHYNSARDRSRWSIRVDKEGLTSINIPASSETGNIPRLLRSEVSNVINLDENGNPTKGNKEDTSKLVENKKRQDIFLDQVGPGGIDVVDGYDGYLIQNRFGGEEKTIWEVKDGKPFKDKFTEHIQAGTAFHNITKVASVLLEMDINKKSSDFVAILPPVVEPGKPSVSNKIVVTSPLEDDSVVPNGGGRSMALNFDGSLEASIGANTIDRVSMMFDTAGGIVSHIGRDKNGRSSIVQTDGDMVFELGGFDFIGEGSTDNADTRFVGGGLSRTTSLPGDKYQFRSGKLVIRIRRSNVTLDGPNDEEQDNLLIFDDNGLTIKTSGRINFISDQNITLESKAQISLKGETVEIMGRQVTRKPQRV
jgi:hypothetical protein